METTNLSDQNTTIKTTPENIKFLNHQNLFPNQSEMDNSFFDSPRKEKVCYNTISESKCSLSNLKKFIKNNKKILY